MHRTRAVKGRWVLVLIGLKVPWHSKKALQLRKAREIASRLIEKALIWNAAKLNRSYKLKLTSLTCQVNFMDTRFYLKPCPKPYKLIHASFSAFPQKRLLLAYRQHIYSGDAFVTVCNSWLRRSQLRAEESMGSESAPCVVLVQAAGEKVYFCAFSLQPPAIPLFPAHE